MPENLSAIIITKNEEKNIFRCLTSLQEIADEIIVVDSFSTDKTPEICKMFHVRFFQNEFNNYTEQKNYALSKTSYPLVLSIDADEEVSAELANSIKKIKQNNFHDGYMVNIKTLFYNKWIMHSGWYPDWKVRIFRKEKGSFTGGRLHEGIKMTKNATISKLKGNLNHYSYPDVKYYFNQLNRYSQISAEEINKIKKWKPSFLILFKSILTFLHRYILKLGFLDGYAGFIICAFTAYGKFAKEAKRNELYLKEKILQQ